MSQREPNELSDPEFGAALKLKLMELYSRCDEPISTIRAHIDQIKSLPEVGKSKEVEELELAFNRLVDEIKKAKRL